MTVELERIDFVLPEELSATRPPEARGLARDEVRLMVCAGGTVAHARFRELPAYLRPGDLVVVNNSAMLSAALDVRYRDRPAVLHFSTRLDNGDWAVELRDPHGTPWAGPAPEPGARVQLPDGRTALLRRPWLPRSNRLWVAGIEPGPASRRNDEVGAEAVEVAELLARHGRPITYSYVPERWSASFYRTVFGLRPGSAEMPSAGRPFTEALVTELVAGGVGVAPITLHTGVSSPEAGEPPSPERFEVPDVTARLVNATHAVGGRVIAVGTTVTRALESATDADGSVHPAAGWTELVLDGSRPARAVDGLITGWHAPGASHLHLLESVAGAQVVRAAYRAALESGYLWHEFGDTALLFRDGPAVEGCEPVF
ncbi:S-adenosylmethionine:tRNA ribosyltransferase-isomerase [Nocardia inohanensis]|uniref:S-adenosylmethionine:tRNA ribosyltransferase-isomerase n=1 Tax=Nocardia inohanensis TaxID=209246 RepID=UPI00082F671B|nr:S-adenosylmethionine:tRNA ribosyltransferase-isomerase [Nocardia inohanensis]